MSQPEVGSKSYAARASIDMTTVVIMVDAEKLAAYLSAHFPVAIRAVPGVPAGKHPLCLELWRVRDGRAEASGVDQHDWLAMSGGTLGAALGTQTGAALGSTYGAAVAATMGGLAFSWLGPLGALWGASAGLIAGAASGGLAGASAGNAIGGEMFRRTAREASEIAARTFGTYHETALLVPNVVRRDGSGPPHQLVLGMLTDSALSKIEADAFGQGFSKQVATACCTPFREWAWNGSQGEMLLEASFEPGEGSAPPAREREVAMFREWTRAPFLGRSVAGELVATEVDRSLDEENVLLAAGRGTLEVGPGFSDILEHGRYEIGAGAVFESNALHAVNCLVRVSRPRRFES